MLWLPPVNCRLSLAVFGNKAPPNTPKNGCCNAANNCAPTVCIQLAHQLRYFEGCVAYACPNTTTSGMGDELIAIESLRPTHPPTVHPTPRDAKVPLPTYPPNPCPTLTQTPNDATNAPPSPHPSHPPMLLHHPRLSAYTSLPGPWPPVSTLTPNPLPLKNLPLLRCVA